MNIHIYIYRFFGLARFGSNGTYLKETFAVRGMAILSTRIPENEMHLYGEQSGFHQLSKVWKNPNNWSDEILSLEESISKKLSQDTGKSTLHTGENEFIIEHCILQHYFALDNNDEEHMKIFTDLNGKLKIMRILPI